jgi:hypothetical protein
VEQFLDVLQLAGFLYVIVGALAVLAPLALGLALFLYLTGRHIVIVKSPPRAGESRIHAQTQS